MKLGLVLAGGGIRGIAHAGVIKALEENNIKIDAIGGTSSGSMIAVLYAIGYTPDEILKLFKKFAKTIVKLNGNVIRKELKNFLFKHKLVSQGINSGEFIEKIFDDVAALKNITNINQLKMPIVMPSVDIHSSKKYIFTSVYENEKNYISDIEIGKAVRASSSFPIIYEPMKYKDKMFLDGGILDNIPINEVKKLGAHRIIAVKFDSDRVDKESNAIDIVMKVADIMGSQIAEENLQNADYVIEVPTDGTGIMDVGKIDYCFESGYKTTIKQIEKIRTIIR